MASSRPPADSLYGEVALPVPLDQTFTYSLTGELRRRAEPGSRVLVPFGTRKLSGVVVEIHERKPGREVRAALRLLDDEPSLSPELLRLGRWIAQYYCAPIGETLKSMLPLGVELKETRVARLTDQGAEAAAQFSVSAADDPSIRLLQTLAKRPLTLPYLRQKVPGAAKALSALEKRGFVRIESEVEDRDPLRARDGRLLVSAGDCGKAPKKLVRGERWLLDFLDHHPGEHDLESLALDRKDVAAVARRLAPSGAVGLRVERSAGRARPEGPRVALQPDQETAVTALVGALEQGGFHPFLLHGVTGSGKTEVYLRAIEKALDLGRSALLLVPEIALTPQVAGQFFARFGDLVAVLHSAFSGWQRAEQWRRIRSGEARVVIGARSGVFAPMADLGLILVDEEHESSYKQEETPRYHGRDVAVVRASQAGAVVVLGSATPSLESRYNAERGKYGLLEMPRRIGRRPLPEVEILDMKQEFLETRRNDMFSRRMVEEVQTRLEKGEQTMLLLNRRGFSMYVWCRKCGHRIECQNCSVTLTYHKRERRLLCHYCDYAEAVPEKCPQCDSEFMHFQGFGSEKVEDALRDSFPKARIARLDRDAVKGRDQYESILDGFREGRYDILVGTQMIAKGHDIPNVTFAGVVSADVGLGVPDFRAAERTFQLLTQVAGRAGRGATPGRVVLQTSFPEHYAVRLAAAQNYGAFYGKEMYFRRNMQYPPFAALAALLIRSKKLDEAMNWSAALGRRLQGPYEGVRLQGPAAAAVPRLKQEYRFRFLLKSRERSKLQAILREARDFAEAESWPAGALTIDVDPFSLL
ncbi:MAG: primosomal protein N' [Acidobacteria bacterium]|nr:primosomal protein N' [Acidobacteriota bacterium]